MHNRVKLCVSKRKVRTLDSRGNSNAFNSNLNLEEQRLNSTSASNVVQVSF